MIASFALPAQASLLGVYGGVTYSWATNRLYIWPSYTRWYPLNSQQPYRIQMPKPGTYLSWKRNNLYYTQMSLDKMAAYKATHAPEVTQNPLDNPQFQNDLKIYSQPDVEVNVSSPAESQ